MFDNKNLEEIFLHYLNKIKNSNIFLLSFDNNV